jgi:hypothetical protein
MGKAESAVEGQPGGEFVLILEQKRLHISPHHFTLPERRIAAVAGHDSEELMVARTKHLKASPDPNWVIRGTFKTIHRLPCLA